MLVVVCWDQVPHFFCLFFTSRSFKDLFIYLFILNEVKERGDLVNKKIEL